MDILSSKNLNDKLNKLYDSKSPMIPKKNANDHNINDSLILSNNYHQMNDKNDDETEKLISTNN